MALFGSDWIQDDSSYDTPIGVFSRDEVYEQTAWDQPIGAPIHNISKSDRLHEYESTIKHFGCFLKKKLQNIWKIKIKFISLQR